MQTDNYKMGTTEWAMLISLALLWGFSYINIKNALTEIEPFSLVSIRLVIAFSALALYCILSGKSFQLTLGMHLRLVGSGLLACAIPFSLFTWGQQYVSTSIGSIFNACVPFFTALLGHYILAGSETMNWRKAIGLSIGCSGIIIMLGIDNLAEFDLSNAGQLAMIGACFFYAASSIYYRKVVGDEVDKIVATCCTLFWAAITMVIVSIGYEGLPTLNYSPDVWLSVSTLALLSTALAYVIVLKLLQRAGPSNTSLNTFLIPIVGISIGIFILDESLKTADIIGVLLIFSGVAIIQNFGKSIRYILISRRK
ncbi:MAG: DMT family transporter [Oceanospirillaceae bacterium]